MKGLTGKQGEELLGFILLCTSCDKSNLTNAEIDRIVERLRVIQTSDPYKKAVFAKVPGGKVDSFVNRAASRECIFGFRFQKIANPLRRLPLEERVSKILDGLDHPPKDLGYDTAYGFITELVRAGKDAVPFIVQHKPCRSEFVVALAELGDPRGIDYIIEFLKTRHEYYAAEALTKFNDKRVVLALVDALQDETSMTVYKEPPVESEAPHEPYLAHYYRVQHTAAKSLSALTGKDWGLLYNEDYMTWSAWLHSGKAGAFTPADVPRSDPEVARLVECLFHRYMSGRPNPWQPQNVLATTNAVLSFAKDLKQLGSRVVPVIVNVCHTRIKETPLWKDELGNWTKTLLVALDWTESRNAAESLGDFRHLSGGRVTFPQ